VFNTVCLVQAECYDINKLTVRGEKGGLAAEQDEPKCLLFKLAAPGHRVC